MDWFVFFFFKQKTAYDMRISDWSSDVCSSDLNLNTGAVVDQFSYDISEDLKLRNIASYSSFKHQYRWDLDGSRAGFNDFINPRTNDEANLDTITEEQIGRASGRDRVCQDV